MSIGQLTHALAALAPDIPEYVPALQFAHAADVVAPVSPEYVPAAQFTHTVAELAPATPEYFPALQLAHAALPFVDLYVPDGHITHCPLEAPVFGPV